jgi:teichoic acid transport system ATP-binding protein
LDKTPLLIIENVSHYFVHRLQSGGKNFFERLLTKIVGKKQQVKALDNINLILYSSEIVGILGKSGAGKSTLGDVMSGLVLPGTGSVYAETKPELLSGFSHFLPKLSGARNISLILSAHGLSDDEIDEQLPSIIKKAKIRKIVHQPVNTYTKKSRQKLRGAITLALLPKILIADVALKAGDKKRTSELRDEVRDIALAGGLVVLAGQRIEVLEEMCDRIIWLEKGAVYMDGDAASVLSQWRVRYPESFDDDEVEESSD